MAVKQKGAGAGAEAGLRPELRALGSHALPQAREWNPQTHAGGVRVWPLTPSGLSGPTTGL